MPGRLALALVLLSLLRALVPSGADAAQSAAVRLADRYTPVLAVEPQKQACGSGEAYRPTSVDLLLGNPEVTLRGPDAKVVKKTPTGADLFGLGEGYYLDEPGDPLNPGCGYEKSFHGPLAQIHRHHGLGDLHDHSAVRSSGAHALLLRPGVAKPRRIGPRVRRGPLAQRRYPPSASSSASFTS